jgi:predicted metalloendopeptidase
MASMTKAGSSTPSEISVIGGLPNRRPSSKERSKAVVQQYSEYEPLPGLHVNGELTQGENIADIGGVKLAYAALQKALAGKPQEKIDGHTPEQRFFLSFATIWKSKQRDEDLKLRFEHRSTFARTLSG